MGAAMTPLRSVTHVPVADGSSPPAVADLRIDVLGTTRVRRGGAAVALTRQDRRVVAALVLLACETGLVESETVEEHAWLRPPTQRALRSTVYRLRRDLGEDAVLTRRRAIGLNPVRLQTDLEMFIAACIECRAHPSVEAADAALRLVRGEPFADLSEHPLWVPIRRTWRERINAVLDTKIECLAERGDLLEAIELTRAQLADNPVAADRWLRLVRMLDRGGRPVDASRAVEEARRAFAAVGMTLPGALSVAATAIVAPRSRPMGAPGGGPGAAPARPVPVPVPVPVQHDSNEHHDLVGEVVRVAAVVGEPLSLRRLPIMLDVGLPTVGALVSEGVAAGLLAVDGDEVTLAAGVNGRAVLDALPPSRRAELARRTAHHAPWAGSRRGAVVRMRLALADTAAGWSAAAGGLLRDVGFDSSLSPQELLAAIDELVGSDEAAAADPVMRSHLEARVSVALHELGRHDEAFRRSDTGYRLAVGAGAGDAVCRSLVLSTFPAVDMVTDRGRHAEALARSWRPSATTAEHSAHVEAVLAFHQLARGPLGAGEVHAAAALAALEDVTDPEVAANVAALVTYDLTWGRNFVEVADQVAAACRAEGRVVMMMRGLAYGYCGRMRRREVSFDHPVMEEFEVLGGDATAWMVVRSAMMLASRSSLRGDTATLERVGQALASSNPNAVHHVVRRLLRLHGRLSTQPEWTTLDPADIVGDPAEWDISCPVDVALWRAASALTTGDLVAAGRLLEAIPGAVLDAERSMLVVTRLPLLAMIAGRVGDRDLAGRLLERNRAAAGTDLSLLPAVHLGPSESWLAALADLAQDPAAAGLHEAAAARLQGLGARVLECS